MSFPSVLGGVQNFDRGSPGKVEVPSPNNGRGSTATGPVSPNTRLIKRAASSGNMEVPSRNGPMPGVSQRPRIMFPPRVPFSKQCHVLSFSHAFEQNYENYLIFTGMFYFHSNLIERCNERIHGSYTHVYFENLKRNILTIVQFVF